MKVLNLYAGLAVAFLLNVGMAQAQTIAQVSYPCSIVLHPVKNVPYALGTALITSVKKPYSDFPNSPLRQRESIGILADWLPSPSSLGNYDQYEGFAQRPGVVSWRFKMYPVKEDSPSWIRGTLWVGRFDDISGGLPQDTRVEVRLSNSKTNKLGPIILQSSLNKCPV